jgi:hypothetical protein
MRKSILFLAVAVATISAQAQETMGSYSTQKGSNKHDIRYSVSDDGSYFLYVGADETEPAGMDGGFMIESENHAAFIEAIKGARATYVKWTEIAKANNVKEAYTEIDNTSTIGGYFYYGDEWNFQFAAKPTFTFLVFEGQTGVKQMLVLETNALVASDNKYITSDGYQIIFHNAAEVDAFLNAISLKLVQETLSKPKTADLFKN